MRLRNAASNFALYVSLAALLCAASVDRAMAGASHGYGHKHDRRSPKVVLISLDGAKPSFIANFLRRGILPPDGGLARVSRGVFAKQNVTATPSLTAVGHIAIATGSTAVHNDIPANNFQPVAGSITSSISGFAAPIGGYEIAPLGPSSYPSAEPLWVRLREKGKKVVAATWPGADGATIRINNVTVQAAEPTRVTDYAVPFGAFGGIGAVGFDRKRSDFEPDEAIAAALAVAGHYSFSPVLATPTPVETFYCSSTTTGTCSTTTVLDRKFEIRVAAIDTKDDAIENYDTLVFFEKTLGIEPGPFTPPATGPAYVSVGGPSQPFFFEGTGNVIGAAYHVTQLVDDLSVVRFARYGANYIPRNAPVLEFVDDVNDTIGFWRPQPDFRIPERLSPGFESFTDEEVEAIYADQNKTFLEYQTDLALHAIEANPDADLIMIYFEEPDGSSHQFLLSDPRQATDPTDPTSIYDNQDRAKIARYKTYVANAYRKADEGVARILDAVGRRSDVFVVSDHGFAPFFTAVSLTNVLRNAGVDTSKLAIRTSGAAANIYINLQGRQSGGTVSQSEYVTLIGQIKSALVNAIDPNPRFNYSLLDEHIVDIVETRPLVCSEGVGFCTDNKIGRDFGDVFVELAAGYNFDGIQSPGVAREGDPSFDSATTELSVPNFYGAHGYSPKLPIMSATFMAAGPHIKDHTTVDRVRNIDVAPTIMHLLGVEPAPQVDGRVLYEILR
jgi:predicted AlkP superfamily pyrophosphatase or phosphodiesterase